MSSAEFDSSSSPVPGTTVHFSQLKPVFNFKKLEKLSEKKKSEIA